MSVDEEERLINQINDIRDKIKRGDTIGQQKVSKSGTGSHYIDEYKSSINSETGI
jgi:hypothetical protein